MSGHDDRIEITIPFPSYIPYARGPYAAGKFGTKLKALCTLEEKQNVEAACAEIGISQADFIRWCCNHVAKKVIENVSETSQSE